MELSKSDIRARRRAMLTFNISPNYQTKFWGKF